MPAMRIVGARRLEGNVKISGAKNAVLPILAATLLNSGISIIDNCPFLTDVINMIKILQHMGCKVDYGDHCVVVDSSHIDKWKFPDELFKELRSSIVLLGPMLARMGKARVVYPGGCDIGSRPIDLHIKGLRKLGVVIEEDGGHLVCSVEKLHGEYIVLDYPSVGATENIMLAAVKADGKTTIVNAAREPEITDLQYFINQMGGRVWGAGTSIITVEGTTDCLHSVQYKVIPDRIVAGTYMAAAAATAGTLWLENVRPDHLQVVIAKFKEIGCDITFNGDTIQIKGPKTIRPADIRTLPYPGFPTDMQAIVMAVLAKADGASRIIETVFENRFKHVDDLIAMGANITIWNRTAIVRGVKRLNGARVNAEDLRGGAALVIAALSADGVTFVDNINHIDRGYEKLDKTLNHLGADIAII